MQLISLLPKKTFGYFGLSKPDVCIQNIFSKDLVEELQSEDKYSS